MSRFARTYRPPQLLWLYEQVFYRQYTRLENVVLLSKYRECCTRKKGWQDNTLGTPMSVERKAYKSMFLAFFHYSLLAIWLLHSSLSSEPVCLQQHHTLIISLCGYCYSSQRTQKPYYLTLYTPAFYTHTQCTAGVRLCHFIIMLP